MTQILTATLTRLYAADSEKEIKFNKLFQIVVKDIEST